MEFTHGIGGTNGWLFFATPYGSTQRYIVKVRGARGAGVVDMCHGVRMCLAYPHACSAPVQCA